jgi:hypothetical protein
VSDTHIHIHLNGEEAKAVTPAKASKRPSRKASSPTKPKRKVSAYHKRMGAELKRLKKKHPKAKSATLMKRAHKHARRK